MSLTNHKPVEGSFYAEIVKPTQEQIDSYYTKTGEIKVAKNGPREFQKAIITHTSDEENVPVNSVWMMGQSPGLVINFFGEKITIIQEKDLYARID